MTTKTITHTNALDIAAGAVRTAEAAILAFLNKHREARRAEWLDVGGCVHCGGSGYVYQRDQSGESDWDPCDRFNTVYADGSRPRTLCTAHAVGMPAGALVSALSMPADSENVTKPVAHPRDQDRSRARSGVTHDDPANIWPAVMPLLTNPDDIAELESLKENLDLAAEILAPLVPVWRVASGCRMIAIRDFTSKGIKVPAGTVGAVVWAQTVQHTEHRYSGSTTTITRVGFKPDGTDTAVFVSVEGKLALLDRARRRRRVAGAARL